MRDQQTNQTANIYGKIKGSVYQIAKVVMDLPLGWRILVIALLVGIFAGILSVLWLLIANPRPSFERVNVGVARFTTPDARGQPELRTAARDVSDWLYTSIKEEVDRLPASLQITVMSPREVGRIRGQDREARAAHAVQVAAKRNIALLVYGEISPDGQGGYQVTPEFLVSDQSFGYGDEVAGPERLGQPIPVSLPIRPKGHAAVNEDLWQRIETLRLIASGIALLYTTEYDQAWAKLNEAAISQPWRQGVGQEVAYVLRGAVDLKRYDQTRAPAHLKEAAIAFSQAIALNSAYARSYLGLGTVAFQQAVLDPEQVDAEKLYEAAVWYSNSLREELERPPSAHIPVRADYGLAQLYVVGHEAGLTGWSEAEAERLLKKVIAAYEREPNVERLQWFAGQAYGRLGHLADIRQDWAAMATHLRAAIKLLDALPHEPARATVARYWAGVGLAEGELGRRAVARDAYAQAIRKGTGYVDQRTLDLWRAEMERLEN